MKRIGLCFIGLLVLVPFFAMFVPQGWCHETLAEEEKTYLKGKREIVFVSQTVYPPFEFVEKQGDHTGMCIELARWMATEFGFKARFTDTAFKEAQQAVLTGEADVLTSLFYSEKRDRDFDFIDTMFEVPASIFVAADRPDIKGIEDLNGKTIAMQKGDYALDFLKSRGISFKVVDTANFAEATDRVIAGEADAVIGDEQIVLYHVYSNDLVDRIKKVNEPLYIGQDCMAVKEGNRILQSVINKGVKKARESGVLDRIERKWLGVQMKLGESFLEKHRFHLMGVLAGMVAMVLLIWFWNIQLRREVASRTDELARSEATLRTILSASPIGIGVLRNKTMDWHNEAMSRITGYGPEEVKGKPPQLLYPDEETGKRTDSEIVEMLRREGSASLETRWRRKDGSVFDCMIRYAPMGGKQENHLFVVLAEDISERKLMQKKLRESEEFLKTVVENIPNMIFVKDAETLRFVQFNRAGEDLLGYGKESLLGKSDYDLFRKEEADFFTGKDHQALRDGNLLDIPEEPVQTKDKGVRILHTKKIPILDRDGLPRYLLGISEDITEKKKIDELLRIQRDLGTALGSKECLKIPVIFVTAYSDMETLRRAKVSEPFGYLKKPLRLEDLRISIEMALYKAEMEQRLRDSEERFRTVADFTYDWETWLGPEGEYLYISPSCERVTGLHRDAFVEKPQLMAQIIHPEDRASLEKHFQVCSDKKGGFFQLEFRIIRPDGNVRWIEHLCQAVFSPDGTYLGRRSSNRDITDRKRAEEALRKSEEKYRFLAEHSADVIYKLNVENEQFTYVSPSVTRMLGYSAEDILSLKAQDALTPESYAKQLERMMVVHANGRREPEILELEAVHKDGHTLPVEVHASLICDERGNPAEVLGVVRDISERKEAEKERMKLEARLQEAKKKEAISALAGGVAHEFNNALTALLGNIELIRMDLPENKEREEYFKDMKDSGLRMARLTDQLLAYARGGKYRPDDLKLDDFVTQSLPVLRHDLPAAIKVETYFHEDIRYVRADHTQMQMVLSALLANSNEAIEDVGRIKIAVENKELDGNFTGRCQGLVPGSYVCLTVEDDGEGMDEETRSRIFEPFFTSKFQGRGMGMAAVYGVVRNHDGWISVESELGKGTAVRICLPVVEVEKTRKEDRPKAEPVKGTGTVLVIEDEDMVMDAIQAMLARLGYRVMTAKTGKDAVHKAKTFDGHIDLALLDIKLPDMEGGKVYPLLMKARPDLKVIVCSGYAIDGPARKILDAGAQDFIQKPLSFAALSEKVKAVLEER